jgi:uncharacterized protein YjbI with pentapeptide repeats
MSDAHELLELDDDGEAVGVRVEGARQPGEAFTKARLVDVEFVRCDLSGCDFSESLWQRVKLNDCRLSSAELSQSRLRDVTFTNCRLDDANFRLSALEAVRFEACMAAGAEFIGGTLERVAFPASDLAGADLSQVRCADVDLRGARLDGLRGVGALAGATIAADQLVVLAPALAHALGMKIAADE